MVRYRLTSVPLEQYNSSVRQLNVATARANALDTENATLRAENEQLRRERDAQRTRQEERVRVLEEALTKRAEWHKCSCPEPCDDYWVFPGGCIGKYREDYNGLLAILRAKEDRA